MKWKKILLIVMVWMTGLSLLHADLIKKPSYRGMDVLNQYQRRRILLGFGFGINQNLYQASTHLNSDFTKNQETIDLSSLDDTYGEGDGNGLSLTIWGDYWFNRRWGLIAQLSYEQNRFSNEGDVTLYRYYGPTYNHRGAISSRDEIKYSLNRLNLSLAPKITFRTIYCYGGIEISIPISSTIEHSSQLTTLTHWRYNIQDSVYFFYNDPEHNSHTKSVDESIPNLKSIIPSVIGGIGFYLPINRKLWCVPEVKFQRFLVSAFDSPIRSYLVLDPSDGKEADYILKMNQPETELTIISINLNLVYRF